MGVKRQLKLIELPWKERLLFYPASEMKSHHLSLWFSNEKDILMLVVDTMCMYKHTILLACFWNSQLWKHFIVQDNAETSNIHTD